MTYDRPLAFLDLEATGTDPTKDRIISVGIEQRIPEHADIRGGMETYFLCNPGQPISDEVAKLTGLSNELLAIAEPFSRYAAPMADWLKDCYLIGFGILQFDLPLLAEEMLRAGVDFQFPSERVIDCGNIYKKKEPRTLAAAVKHYISDEAAESFATKAHHALNDAQVTADVFMAQVARYADLRGMTGMELAAFSAYDKRVDYAGKLVLINGDICYNIGKAKGTRVKDDTGFGYWMLGKDFPLQTQQVLRRLLDECEQTKEALYASESNAGNVANNPNAGGGLPF